MPFAVLHLRVTLLFALKSFTSSFNLPQTMRDGKVSFPHLIAEHTEAQRGQTSDLRSHSFPAGTGRVQAPGRH